MARLSDMEIISRWNSAYDKDEEFDQLAVACRTDRAGMRRKLIDLGLMEGPKRGGSHPKMDRTKARQLYEDGLTDGAIAKQLGVASQTVNKWRNDEGLPAHGFYHGDKKKKSTEAATVAQLAPEPTALNVTDGEAQEPRAPRFRMETPVKVAQETEGLCVAQLAELFSTLDVAVSGGDTQITVSGKKLTGVTVTLRYNGRCVGGPDEIGVELEAG